jgi:hypothetical protein
MVSLAVGFWAGMRGALPGFVPERMLHGAVFKPRDLHSFAKSRGYRDHEQSIGKYSNAQI